MSLREQHFSMQWCRCGLGSGQGHEHLPRSYSWSTQGSSPTQLRVHLHCCMPQVASLHHPAWFKPLLSSGVSSSGAVCNIVPGCTLQSRNAGSTVGRLQSPVIPKSVLMMLNEIAAFDTSVKSRLSSCLYPKAFRRASPESIRS